MSVRTPQEGQALVLLVAGMLALVIGAVALGWVAAGLASAGDRQRTADLAALAGARALFDARWRAAGSGEGSLSRSGYLAGARAAARSTALRNGARDVDVRFPSAPLPDRVTVEVRDAIIVLGGRRVGGGAVAEAALDPSAGDIAGDGLYTGPLAYRQGRPMRPDVALAFDRLEAAARRAGHRLIISSAYRSNSEQARLFAAHPDPKWVARPGRSLHRLGTELDLGPRSAYAWLAARAEHFGFRRRYSWEPWHFGYFRDAGSASVGFAPRSGAGALGSAPAAYARLVRGSAQRWGVGAALLAAQLRQESGFDPHAVSRAGARGIAQFMPATARAYGLRDPFDAAAAIDAQAHLMHDLLRRFGSVPLALAAYNAGPGRVAACWCVPAISETRLYVSRIVAATRGTSPAEAGGMVPVRLVR